MIGIVAPEESVGAEGLPGCSSTNQLPSRKIRGRIFMVASEWIGRPRFSISMLTRPVLPSRLRPVTLPTSTPAIRTGALVLMLRAVANTAFRRYPCLNGMCLVKPKYTAIRRITRNMTPTRSGL